jgi:Dual specificity phosphatase, catalytic domain
MNIIEMVSGKLYINGKMTPEDWAFAEKDITAIVNLRTKPDRPPFDFSHRIMIWTPVTIWVAPSIEWVDTLMKQINLLYDQKHRILIHDTIGIQRLGFVIAAFYMFRFKLNSKEALKAVREKKSDLQPTQNYMGLLKEYERYLGVR